MKNTIFLFSVLIFLLSCKKDSHINATQTKKTGSENIKKKSVSRSNSASIGRSADIWVGNYHFEATNRDEAKTAFDIKIISSDNISITITEDGKISKYQHLKAEKISTDKIKILYDNSADEMGVIYIEKSDDKYFISGNPIYFINPGNNEMPLKKIK